MANASHSLRFLWWNLQSFAHFDPAQTGEMHWPSSVDEFHGKMRCVADALRQLCGDSPPDVLVFSEITRAAADELRDRAFPNHTAFSLDLLPRSKLQVAFLYRPADAFLEQPPIVAPDTPRGTRPMGAIDFLHGRHRIRIIGCHWQARFRQKSEHTRSDLARFLNKHVYEYIREGTTSESRHAVILGDLNEEPYGLVEERLNAARSRAHSRRREHYTDRDESRIRLYNCSWRLIGEREPHRGFVPKNETAGTYFWPEERTWHTFDHVIVTGSLLTEQRPFLDETSLAVAAHPAIIGEDGRPRPFNWNAGKPSGVSDHLPITGRIVLQTEEQENAGNESGRVAPI